MSAVSTTLPPGGGETDTGRMDGASRLRIFTVLAVIVVYCEITPLQFVMVSAALQKISKSFPAVGANLNWAVIIVSLVGGSAMPLMGKIGDVWGKKRIFTAAGVFFVVGCVICALTNNWTLFLIGRGLSALSLPTQLLAYGLVRDLLPRKYVPLGLGITATGVGFSSVLAPLIGGLLVDNFSWHAMFWFLAIFTLVMTPILWFVVPESKLRVKERIDPIGVALLSGGVALVLIYVDKGQDWGWGHATTLAWLIVGLALMASFFVVESRLRTPLIDMKTLLNPRVGVVLLMALFGIVMLTYQSYAMGYMTQTPSAAQLKGVVAQGVVAQAQQMAHFKLPLSAVAVAIDPSYKYGNGFSLLSFAWHIGLFGSITAMLCGPVAALIARRSGARLPAIMAMMVMVVGGVVYALVPYSWGTYAGLSVVMGIGFGFFYASAPILLVDAVPQEQQGITAGMFGIVTALGSGITLSVAAAILNTAPIKAHINVMGHSITQAIPQVFADRGFINSFWAATGAAVVGLVFALLLRHGRTPTTAGATIEGVQVEAAEAAEAVRDDSRELAAD